MIPSRRALGLLALPILAGCPSRGGEPRDAQAPTAPGLAPTGPLASLEAQTPVEEGWTVDGQPAVFLYYGREDVRLSATCRRPPGLACEALRVLRGAPIELPRRAIDGRQSAGIKACTKLGVPIVVGQNPMGSQDSFCRFSDGSMVAAGAIERYSVRVIE